MRSADQIHVMLLQKARYHVWAKGERDTTIIFAPAGNVLVWIRPQKIAKKTTVGDLKASVSIREKLAALCSSRELSSDEL